jgi:hypothetical protein
MNLTQLVEFFEEEEYDEIRSFVQSVFNDDYESFYDFLKSKTKIDDKLVDKFFIEEIPNQHLKIMYERNPQTTINYIVDNFLGDVQKNGEEYFMTIGREDLSNFFDDRGRDGTARDVAKRLLSDEAGEWYYDSYIELENIISELNKTNFEKLKTRFLEKNEGKNFNEETITKELVDEMDSNDISEAIKELDVDLSSELQNLYSSAENYAYESELYDLVYDELKEFFGYEDFGKWENQSYKRIDGEVINKEVFRVNVTKLLDRVIPEYLNMHLTEPDNQLEYQGNLEYVLNDLFDEGEDRLDFRIPEYPDYSRTRENINDLFVDYI